ncbi:hypothetical protein FS749_003149 [Ceratobasidium sp. UAMH 11750]|nr:hypothetical protein FS749_003149 [Ceratobasidium sp. UAMH 11750]
MQAPIPASEERLTVVASIESALRCGKQSNKYAKDLARIAKTIANASIHVVYLEWKNHLGTSLPSLPNGHRATYPISGASA